VLRFAPTVLMAGFLLAGAGLATTGCSSDSTSESAAVTTSAGVATSSSAAPTTAPTGGSTPASPTSAPAPTSPTTAAPIPIPGAPEPGSACTQYSSVDCIDPFGDGQFVYLIGGGACIAASPSAAICADLDGDGYAGYPDAG